MPKASFIKWAFFDQVETLRLQALSFKYDFNNTYKPHIFHKLPL